MPYGLATLEAAMVRRTPDRLSPHMRLGGRCYRCATKHGSQPEPLQDQDAEAERVLAVERRRGPEVRTGDRPFPSRSSPRAAG